MSENNETPKPKQKMVFAKKEIADKIGVSPKSVKRYIDRYKKQILIIEPDFMDRKLISLRIACFLYGKFTGNDFIDQEEENEKSTHE